MINILKSFVFILLLLPVIAFGQFYGNQGSDYWIADPSSVSGSNTDISNKPIDSINGTNADIYNKPVDSINGDNSVTTNIGTGTCQISTISGKKTIASYIGYFGCMVRVSILPVLFTLAVVAFVFGVVKMITNSANEEAQTKGKQFILTGIIGLFIIISMYALVFIIRRTVGFSDNTNDGTQYNQLKDKVLRNK